MLAFILTMILEKEIMNDPTSKCFINCQSCCGVQQFAKVVLGSKDLEFYVFRTLICIVGKPWSKQYV